GGHTVDVHQLAAGAPFQQGLRDPRFLLQLRIARAARAFSGYRVEFPVDTAPARARQILKRVEGQIDEATRHRPIPTERLSPATRRLLAPMDRTRAGRNAGGISTVRALYCRSATAPATGPVGGVAGIVLDRTTLCRYRRALHGDAAPGCVRDRRAS